MQSWSILFFLIVLLVVPIIVVVASKFALGRRRSGQNPEDGATCGQCGYSVRGVSELWCPECGADLREVGIDRPIDRPKKSGLSLVVIIMVVLMLFGFGMVMYLFKSSAPPKATPAPTAAPKTSTQSTPISPTPNP